MSTAQVIPIPVTPLDQNCSLLIVTTDSGEKSAVLVDPGGDCDRVVQACQNHQVHPEAIWLTHSHFDHCGGVAKVLEHFNVPLFGHRAEATFRQSVLQVCEMYGLRGSGMENCPEPTNYLEGGEVLSLGDVAFDVLFTPGHSPGHLCFYGKEFEVLIGGDALFAGSIGRTDLPGGDHQQLLQSIERELMVLPDQVVVYPGHGPTTTIGRERLSNPFVGREAS